jgi:hypothetical protein
MRLRRIAIFRVEFEMPANSTLEESRERLYKTLSEDLSAIDLATLKVSRGRLLFDRVAG